MSFSNIALYIKRAEVYQDGDYIKDSFRYQNYGEVSEVKFIEKLNSVTGIKYYGAIVKFKIWFNNSHVRLLLERMSISTDGTAKVYHGYDNRYWVVCQFKEQTPSVAITNIDQSLPDKVRIAELEKLVASLSAQMHFMQLEQEKKEQKFMDYEFREIRSALVNAELRAQLEEKQAELEADVPTELTNARLKIAELGRQVETVQFELEEKKIECEALQEELYEERNILAYIHAQANEMRDMLHIDLKPLKGKMTIEELM
jgi:hypothetical protein